MKKHIIAASLLLAVIAGGTLFYRQYTSVRHPVVEKGGDGWNFIYDLCIPAPMPMHCVESRRTIYVPKGYTSAILPHPHRMKAVETLADAREEAELVADMVEGKYKGEPEANNKIAHVP
jgi:hypothetical protein